MPGSSTLPVDQEGVPYNDLRASGAGSQLEVEAAALRVLRSGRFLFGAELDRFEHALAAAVGVRFAVGCGSGTDAIELILRAARIGPGDEVVTVSHTAIATVMAICRTGAIPVMVDIDPATYTMDVAGVEAALTNRTRAIIPVHLYGQPAAMAALTEVARTRELLIVEDCAQAIGARYAGQRVGSLGDAAAMSFYPTKNLGACGDAGAVLTDDNVLADRVRELRSYGQNSSGISLEVGLNSRLDEIQAAILLARLPGVAQLNAERGRIAARYTTELVGVTPPIEVALTEHVYHIYCVRSGQRDLLRRGLAQRGIDTMVHYPIPAHRHPSLAGFGPRSGALSETDRAVSEIVSLPLFPGMTNEQVGLVIQAVNEVVEQL